MSQHDVRGFYESFGEREWDRLERAADGAIELRVMHNKWLDHAIGSKQ